MLHLHITICIHSITFRVVLFWGLFTLRSAARFETTTLPPTTADAVFSKSLYTTHDLSSLQESEWSNCAFLLEAVSWHFFNDMPSMSRKQNTCFAQSAIYILHTCIHTLPYITLHCVALRYTTVHCITYHIHIHSLWIQTGTSWRYLSPES